MLSQVLRLKPKKMETDEMNGQSSQFGFPPPFHGDIATAKNLGITHMVLGNMADQYNTGVVDPSTEIADVDSRKRPLDASSDIRQPFKRSNFGDVDSYRTNTTNRAAKSPILKVLVPNYAAGSIIGKGGQNIAQVQQSTGARIKLSPNNHYYPGTQERIGLIIGEVENIITMLNFVVDKIRQEPQQAKMNANIQFDTERAKQMKIVVPNSTAGMIIGKGGSAIKSYSEQTGARIQISQKDADSVAGERIVNVSGTEEQVQAACSIIAAKVQEDPEHALNNNIMYTGLTSQRHANGHFGTNLQLGTLSGFGGIGLPGTTPGSQGTQGTSTANHILAQAALMGGSNPLSSALGISPPSTATTSTSIQSSATLEITVPDELIGAILGKGGKTINELMQYSGARIQVSQKGEFVPGTNNRKVVITGDVQAAQLAHFLITQRLQQVEAERLVNPQPPSVNSHTT